MKYIFLLFIVFLSGISQAKTESTITDLQGRQLHIQTPVDKIFLIDARDILAIDIAAGAAGFKQIAGWTDSLSQYAPDMKEAYFSSVPELKQIPILAKSRETGISVEKIIQLAPEVVLTHKANYAFMLETNAISQLESAGIQVVVIDFRSNAAENTPKSIQLIGKLLGNEDRADKFATLYKKKLANLNTKLTKPYPSLLIESNAGLYSEACCNLYGRSGYGTLAALAGGNNLAASKLPANGGESSIENIIYLDPDFYLITGADWSNFNRKSIAVKLGYNADGSILQSQLKRLINRQGISSLSAIKNKKVMAIYHNFYNNPLNIFAIEAMAKFFNPQAFSDIDPDKEIIKFHQEFTSIKTPAIFWITLD